MGKSGGCQTLSSVPGTYRVEGERQRSEHVQIPALMQIVGLAACDSIPSGGQTSPKNLLARQPRQNGGASGSVRDCLKK